MTPKLEWCVVRLGDDMNWWVAEINDTIHWDVDGLGIIDPRQFSYILDLLEPLSDFGLDYDYVEAAFISFAVEKDLGNNRVRLVRSKEALLESEEQLFALPDVADEEKGPYADFLNHITRIRVKMLNSLIDFKKNLTVDELEDEIRESQNHDYFEGRGLHFFTEICAILEYVPEGFEIDEDDKEEAGDDDSLEADFPDLEESEENIEEDETMRWEDEEEEEEAEGEDLDGFSEEDDEDAPAADEEDEDLDDLDDDDEDDEDDEEDEEEEDDDDFRR